MPGGKRGRRKVRTVETARKVEAKAEYVITCIRDQPWLDGSWSRLRTLVEQRYGCKRNASERAITRAYELMDEERKRNLTHIVAYLDRTHRRVIEMGLKSQDGRIITPAAAELRKLHGVGEPDQLRLSGAVSHGVTLEDAELLSAMRLTNAQRQAEIDKLTAELAPPGAATPAPQPTTEDDDDDDA